MRPQVIYIKKRQQRTKGWPLWDATQGEHFSLFLRYSSYHWATKCLNLIWQLQFPVLSLKKLWWLPSITLMVPELITPRESLLTNAASESFLPCVTGRVLRQVNLLCEPFPTDRAKKRFLSCVRDHMSLQIRFLQKCLIANGAAKGFLSRVSHHMFLQISFLPKSLIADRAAKRFLSCMSHQVFL